MTYSANSKDVTQTYKEYSPGYFAFSNSGSTVSKVYKKGVHFYDGGAETDAISYTDTSGDSISGTRVMNSHGEWYVDVSVVAGGAQNPYELYGLAECSVGAAVFVISDTKSTNGGGGEIYVAGKFVVSAVQRSFFTGSWTDLFALGAGSNAPILQFNVAAYGLNNQPVSYTAPAPGSITYTCPTQSP